MTEHAFGRAPAFTVGIEEELLLVDRDTHQLAPNAADVLSRLDGLPPGSVGHEAFAAELELRSPAADDADAATTALGAARAAAGRAGATLIGAGLHPSAALGDAELVAKERYRRVEDEMRGLIRRTPECALHVHVGMPDADAAVHALNGLREALPLLQALAANSPYWFGRDSGLASARAAAVRSYPRFELPRAFRDYEDFLRVADQLIAAAGVSDYTYIWWDVRPHPNLGTVEVRGMDVQPRPQENAAIAALIQALAAKEIDRPGAPGLAREAIEESYFQAERYGLEARLMVDESTAAPATEVARGTLEEARPYAADLGGEGALEEIERIVAEGNGADRQRRVHGEHGIEALLSDLAERTRV